MGISKRGKRWRAFIRIENGEGENKNKSIGTFDSKIEAVKAVEYAQSLANTDNRMAYLIPFYEYFEWYFLCYKKSSSTIKTQGHYMDTKRYIQRYLGNISLSKLTNDRYVKLLHKFAEDYAPGTLEKFHSHMRACVKQAFALGHIPVEFTSGVSLRGLGDKTKEKPAYHKYIDDRQYKEVLSYLYKNRNKDSSIYYAIIFSLLTGCRFGELAGVTIDDLNFESGYIDINKAYDYANAPNNWSPCKTANSYRKIEMPDNLAELLQEFLMYQKIKCREHNVSNIKNQVFFDWQEGLCSNSKANKVIKQVLIENNIKDKKWFSMHCCRHTFISFLIFQGYSVEEVSVIAGDMPEQVRKTYYHVFQDYEIRTRSKTKDLMNGLF